jgi:hypothetical protein
MDAPVPVGDAVITVKSLLFSHGDYGSRAAEGRIWALVKVAISNNGATVLDIGTEQFLISAGEEDIPSTHAADRCFPFLLESQELPPGTSVEGRIVFDVPETEADLLFKWRPPWVSQEVVVKLTAQDQP